MTRFERILGVRKRVVFRKPRGCVGFCELESGGKILVAIGPTAKGRPRVPPAQIFLHECLHHLYPDWPERKVLATERRMWRRLTTHQRYRLYRKLFNRPYQNGGDK